MAGLALVNSTLKVKLTINKNVAPVRTFGSFNFSTSIADHNPFKRLVSWGAVRKMARSLLSVKTLSLFRSAVF